MRDVASKIALTAALLAGGIGVLIARLEDISLLYAAVLAAIVGVGVHAAVRRVVTRHLRRLDEVLTSLRSEGGREDERLDAPGDELDRLVRKADQAGHAVAKRMTDLSRAESYRREYVGDVSHEIKTPIFAIQGFAETLLNGALDDPQVNRGFVEKILHHSARLSALARDLAEISRLEAGTLKLQRTSVHVGRIFDEVSESLEHHLRQKAIDIEMRVASDATWLDADRDRLRQVVTNLADNAVKYNRVGGHVRLETRREGRFVRVSVVDDGPGIAAADVPRVTERFYRAARSRSRAQGGTGLGLSIVKHILAAHEAVLEIESTVGVGSTFSFRLLAAEKAASPEA